MRRWVVAGALIAAALVAGVWAWTRVAPSLVLRAARNAARSHLGAEIEANDISVGPRSVTMTGVRLVRAASAGVIEIESIRLVPSITDVVFGRTRFHVIEARGVRLDPTLWTTEADAANDGATEASDEPVPEGKVATIVRKLERLRDLLTDGGAAELTDVRLVGRTASTPLSIEHAKIERRDGGLRSAGSLTAGDGVAKWDVELDPDALHAAGDVEIEGLPLAAIASFLPRAPWDVRRPTRLDASVTVRETSPGQPPRVEGTIALHDLWLDGERLAERPIGPIELAVRGRADWHLRERRLDIAEGTVTWNGVPVELTGKLSPSRKRYLVDLDAKLPDTACRSFFGAIPEAVLGELAAFDWQGSIGGRGKLHVDAQDLDATKLDVRLDNRCTFVQIPVAADLARFEGPFEHVAPAADGDPVIIEAGPGTADWTPLERISPFLIHAVLAHEDAGFFEHEGFAEYAIEEALEKNLERHKFAFGASTISMQLARNLFLTRDKTLARKVREVLLTWWLEDRWTKERILEMYLNVIEYGPNVYGIGAAAARYFGCTPADLTLAQAVYLATILPSPVKSDRRNFATGALTAHTRGEMQFLVRHMGKRGRVTEAAAVGALAEIEEFAFAPRQSRWQHGMTADLPLATTAELFP